MRQCAAGLYSPQGDEKGSGMNRPNDLVVNVKSGELNGYQTITCTITITITNVSFVSTVILT